MNNGKGYLLGLIFGLALAGAVFFSAHSSALASTYGQCIYGAGPEQTYTCVSAGTTPSANPPTTTPAPTTATTLPGQAAPKAGPNWWLIGIIIFIFLLLLLLLLFLLWRRRRDRQDEQNN